MPKIIKNLERKLLEEAKRQVDTLGYSATTIRSVASACGVGVGTVYNYYPSKDALLAAYLLEDWQQCVTAINAVGQYSETPLPVAACIYDQLQAYSARHRAVFRDEAAHPSFAGAFSRYHAMLREQLAQPLRKFCQSGFEAQFAAESLLCWTMAGKPFDEIYSILQKLF